MRKNSVLVTCGGQYVGMILQLKMTMPRIPALMNGHLIVADKAELTPAGLFADRSVQVPAINDPQYIQALLAVCEEYNIRVIVPLIDIDLVRISPYLHLFWDKGIEVVCPPEHLVHLCFDKALFQEFLNEEGIAYPKTYKAGELGESSFPVFYKSRLGFGSIGSGVAKNFYDLQNVMQDFDSFVVQKLILAPEVSADAYISKSGQCTVCVPRIREKVVGGQAHVSRTIMNSEISETCRRIIKGLTERGLRGPLNIQLFLLDKPLVIEVNTRLGSASLLSNIASKERLFFDLLNEASGGKSEGNPDEYVSNLSLYRFLGDVFHMHDHVYKVLPSNILPLLGQDNVT